LTSTIFQAHAIPIVYRSIDLGHAGPSLGKPQTDSLEADVKNNDGDGEISNEIDISDESSEGESEDESDDESEDDSEESEEESERLEVYTRSPHTADIAD
jgi:hypothetical protein